jgi:hypothetical protein
MALSKAFAFDVPLLTGVTPNIITITMAMAEHLTNFKSNLERFRFVMENRSMNPLSSVAPSSFGSHRILVAGLGFSSLLED